MSQINHFALWNKANGVSFRQVTQIMKVFPESTVNILEQFRSGILLRFSENFWLINFVYRKIRISVPGAFEIFKFLPWCLFKFSCLITKFLNEHRLPGGRLKEAGAY